jgi:ABC-type Zn2+ transport system substrate-binding protein/surface adhesin
MAFFLKQLLAFCVLAGMASAVMHENAHSDHETCAQTHEHSDHHDHDHHPLPDDCKDHDGAPHHHHCCNFPIADRPSLDRHVFTSFNESLLEISNECSLIPDEPFFSMDKPPLI